MEGNDSSSHYEYNSRQQNVEEEQSGLNITIIQDQKQTKLKEVPLWERPENLRTSTIPQETDSLPQHFEMNSTGNPGHSRESYTNAYRDRRYTEPYRPSRSSQVSHTGAFRSLSNVSEYRKPHDYQTQDPVSSRRHQTVSPDFSLNSNFERMNMTGNGSISPASSTFTLSSQIVNHDFEFTVARLRFVLDYTFHMSKLTTTVSKVELTNERMIKDKECMEIDLMLLPDKRQSFRIKTKSFTEPHAFYIYPRERLPQMRLRFRLYENARIRKRALLAEGVFALKNVRLGFELITLDIEMFPPSRGLAQKGGVPIQEERNLSPVSLSTEASMSMRMGQEPELLVSLQHRASVQRLNIEILKTRGQTVYSSKSLSMYVEIKIISSLGDLLFDTKTSTRRDCLNPEFNEKFSFFLAEHNLMSVTLLVTLLRVSRPFGRKSLIGRFSVGRNNSDKSEEEHWNEVICGQDCGPLLKWHKLYKL